MPLTRFHTVMEFDQEIISHYYNYCLPIVRCTCVDFKLRIKRESTYFETHGYSLTALKRVSTIKYAFLPLANHIVL